MSPPPRAPQKTVRDRVLETAELLGDAWGTRGLTILQIAALLGLPVERVQECFTDEAAILREIRHRFATDLDLALASAELGISDPRARLQRLCTAYVRMMRNDRWRCAVFFSNHETLPSPSSNPFIARALACVPTAEAPDECALRLWIALQGLVDAIHMCEASAAADHEREFIDHYIRVMLRGMDSDLRRSRS